MSISWYVVSTLAAQESKVAAVINEQVEKLGLHDRILRVVVPVQSVTQIRRGKKISVDKKVMPGYVFVMMLLDDECWTMIKNVPGVAGFLGATGKPLPVSESEIERLLHIVNDKAPSMVQECIYKIGDEVRIKEGPFETFNGIVESIDYDKCTVHLSLSIFARAINVDLTFSQVEKVSG